MILCILRPIFAIGWELDFLSDTWAVEVNNSYCWTFEAFLGDKMRNGALVTDPEKVRLFWDWEFSLPSGLMATR